MIVVAEMNFPLVIQSGDLLLEHREDVGTLLAPYLNDTQAALMQFGCEPSDLGKAILREGHAVEVGLKLFYSVCLSRLDRVERVPGAHVQIVPGSDGNVSIHGGAPGLNPYWSITWLNALLSFILHLFVSGYHVIHTNSRSDNRRACRILLAAGFARVFTRHFVPTSNSPNAVDQWHFRLASDDFYRSRIVKRVLKTNYRCEGLVLLKPVRFPFNDPSIVIPKATEEALGNLLKIAAGSGAVIITPENMAEYSESIENNTVVRELLALLGHDVSKLMWARLNNLIQRSYLINPTRFLVIFNGESISAAIAIFVNVTSGATIQLSLSIGKNSDDVQLLCSFLNVYLSRITLDVIGATRIQVSIGYGERRLDTLLGKRGFVLEEVRASSYSKVFGFTRQK